MMPVYISVNWERPSIKKKDIDPRWQTSSAIIRESYEDNHEVHTLYGAWEWVEARIHEHCRQHHHLKINHVSSDFHQGTITLWYHLTSKFGDAAEVVIVKIWG